MASPTLQWRSFALYIISEWIVDTLSSLWFREMEFAVVKSCPPYMSSFASCDHIAGLLPSFKEQFLLFWRCWWKVDVVRFILI
jgi:hypothetical protein